MKTESGEEESSLSGTHTTGTGIDEVLLIDTEAVLESGGSLAEVVCEFASGRVVGLRPRGEHVRALRIVGLAPRIWSVLRRGSHLTVRNPSEHGKDHGSAIWTRGRT